MFSSCLKNNSVRENSPHPAELHLFERLVFCLSFKSNSVQSVSKQFFKYLQVPFYKNPFNDFLSQRITPLLLAACVSKVLFYDRIKSYKSIGISGLCVYLFCVFLSDFSAIGGASLIEEAGNNMCGERLREFEKEKRELLIGLLGESFEEVKENVIIIKR